MKEKVVLAFSGGLDTSFCVPYLKNEKGLEVHTIMVNTGGFSAEEVKRSLRRNLGYRDLLDDGHFAQKN